MISLPALLGSMLIGGVESTPLIASFGLGKVMVSRCIVTAII